jgi:hypothetical protein
MQSTTFSIDKLNSNLASYGRCLEGDELRVCYDTETEFSTGLRKIPYPKSGRWVRSGYQWVMTRESRVKAFSLVQTGRLGWVCRVRVAGLSGLTSDKTKTSPHAGFSLIPNPDRVSWVNWFRSAWSG